MFGRSKRLRADVAESLIGEHAQVYGDVHFSSDLVVLGSVHGNIVATVDSGCVLSLSESSRVEGEIRVPNIIVDGTIAGDVYSSERVQLSKNARIIGNVYYRLIEMEMGAEVNGSLVHVSDNNDPRLSLQHEPASPAALEDRSTADASEEAHGDATNQS
jgi:cytoskeletal protein CcmA (bactofilin family)